MAYDIHPSFYENKSLREAIFLQRHIRYSVCKYRSFARRTISTVKSNSVDYKTSNITVSQSFDSMKEHYQKKGYAFCEDVFNIPFHKEIIDHWPSKVYFNPPSSRDKFFNTGFGMSPSKEGVSSFKDYDYPWQGRKYFHKDFWYNRLLKYFLSPQFEKRVSMVAGKSMCFARSALTLAEPGSQIPLHFDEVKKDGAREDDMTCIFFINGVNELESGHLSIVNDNNWQDIVFQPKNLINSLLIFNPSKDFYHGFKKIDRRKFRWAFTCSFFPK